MRRSDSTPPHRRFDPPALLLLAWVLVMGGLYARSMAAERGHALLAPFAAVASRIGLAPR